MKIAFDIGANDGNDSIWRAFQGDLVYGFEPHPGFYDMINSKIKDLPNYKLINKAVSDFNGQSSFNILQSEDCSSLSTVNYSCEESWDDLKNKLNTLATITVDVITLESFIVENNIETIDWLHIDAQGHDLNVLYGLGDYYKIVKEGILETVNDPNNTLYQNQHSFNDVKDYMDSKGFVIQKIVPSNWGQNPENWIETDVSNVNEVNVYFTNPNFQEF